jgi:hypothetical protein
MRFKENEKGIRLRRSVGCFRLTCESRTILTRTLSCVAIESRCWRPNNKSYVTMFSASKGLSMAESKSADASACSCDVSSLSGLRHLRQAQSKP